MVKNGELILVFSHFSAETVMTYMVIHLMTNILDGIHEIVLSYEEFRVMVWVSLN